MRSVRAGIAAIAMCASASLSAQAPGEGSAVPNMSCDRECLLDILGRHMAALAERAPMMAPLAPNVQFTENNVLLTPGEGLWATVTAVDAVGLEVADPSTGNAAWFGSVRENGAPAIYAVRIHVQDGQIDEIESVVHRKTLLPAPFGDTDNMVHDPAFYEILPPEERRPRERLRAIADSYFNTVELNDGQVFAPFHDDCGRLENGISTTSAPKDGATGNSNAIAQGCEAQFKLGIYRINKRIRERLYPIIDTERGIVVASGFFDHANEFDRYLLTDGREMKTLLKWPNSITLLEAFRIKDAQIHRIEAVFTYVPYFMHNPWAGPLPAVPHHAPDPKACDDACLEKLTNSLMQAYVGNEWQGLPWASRVAYSENSVGIRVGEGIWATITAVDDDPLIVADAETGKAVWIGRIEEHGQPAWAAITLSAGEGGRIGGVEALIRRSEYGPLYAEPEAAPKYGLKFGKLPAGQRISRADMIKGASRFFDAIAQHNAAGPGNLAKPCQWVVNGQDLGDCAAGFASPGLATIGAVRDRVLLAVDEARGLAVFGTFEDVPALGEGYPRSFQVVELFRFESGQIARVEGFTSELPLGMAPHR